MAIAWSRISSKVIAHPLYADAACSRRCGNGTGRSGICIPHMVGKRKQEVLGARYTESTPLPQARRACVACAWADCHRKRPTRNEGTHHVSSQTIHEKTRQSQTAPPPHSTGAHGARPPSGATRR